MLLKSRRSAVGHGDNRVLIYAALFLVCALLSALGAGNLAVLAFAPAVVMVEVIARWGGAVCAVSGERDDKDSMRV